MAYDGDELREELERHRTKSVIPNRLKQKAPVQLLKAPLQSSLAHRERLQQVEGLPPYRNSLRQAGAKRQEDCLPRRSPCMVDLMKFLNSSGGTTKPNVTHATHLCDGAATTSHRHSVCAGAVDDRFTACRSRILPRPRARRKPRPAPPDRVNDPALGDHAGDETGRRDVEPGVRDRRAVRPDAHGRNASVGGAAGDGRTRPRCAPRSEFR